MRDLPEDRLATADQEGRRIYLYPADVYGFFRKWRTKIQAVLICVFLLLPWIKIGGQPLLLLDVAQRRFTIFGMMFWAHEAPLLLFLAAGGALTLGLITAIWGRVWCGWACPQTVFIDGVFRRIERLIEGNSLNRKNLDAGPWTEEKIFKKGLKWSLFTLVSLVIAHSFLAYFVGTDALSIMMAKSPSESPGSFGVMAGVAALILFDFGWFREQFCTVVCPYGRFQSLLMDEHSLAVLYDVDRGEPRRGEVTDPAKPQGDCVNCYRCVQVCPTGIDIRRGVQLECIACTACIDACDEVMTRINKPQGLIRYDSEKGLKKGKVSIFRARTTAYLFLLIGAVSGLSLILSLRSPVQIEFLRASDTPYQELITDPQAHLIVNRLKVAVSNESFNDVDVSLEAMDADGVKLVMPLSPLKVVAGQKGGTDLFVTFPKKILSQGRAKLKIKAVGEVQGRKSDILIEEVPLVGPYF